MSQNYVLLSVRWENWIVGVVKDRPAWQNGRLNLPGGKVEPGEQGWEAALREMKEELGVGVGELEDVRFRVGGRPFTPVGTMVGKFGQIEVYDFVCEHGRFPINPRAGETERPEWMLTREVVHHPMVLQNLKVMIPLITGGVRGWKVWDEGCPLPGERHQITIGVG
jgi:8-oxo-dGTP pyrophosphatase MutT (NUDIX family)